MWYYHQLLKDNKIIWKNKLIRLQWPTFILAINFSSPAVTNTEKWWGSKINEKNKTAIFITVTFSGGLYEELLWYETFINNDMDYWTSSEISANFLDKILI